MHKLAAVLLAIAALCSGRGTLGQRAEAPFVLREDLPHIGCRVCEIVVQRLRDNVEAARAAAPYNKITELVVLDEIENICDHKKPGGWWMLEYDIVQRDNALVLEKQDSKSKCEHECLTMQHSCVELLESEIDQDDLSALLWKGKLSSEQLQRKVCSQWTSRCSSQTSRRKVGERQDYPFVPLSERDLQLQQLMAAMGDTGMGSFDVMDREAMLAQMAAMDPDELAQMYGGEDMPDMYGGMEGGFYDEF